MRCEVCGLKPVFRYYKNLEMCIICYQLNMQKQPSSFNKEIKPNADDIADIARMKDRYAKVIRLSKAKN